MILTLFPLCTIIVLLMQSSYKLTSTNPKFGEIKSRKITSDIIYMGFCPGPVVVARYFCVPGQ